MAKINNIPIQLIGKPQPGKYIIGRGQRFSFRNGASFRIEVREPVIKIAAPSSPSPIYKEIIALHGNLNVYRATQWQDPFTEEWHGFPYIPDFTDEGPFQPAWLKFEPQLHFPPYSRAFLHMAGYDASFGAAPVKVNLIYTGIADFYEPLSGTFGIETETSYYTIPKVNAWNDYPNLLGQINMLRNPDSRVSLIEFWLYHE